MPFFTWAANSDLSDINCMRSNIVNPTSSNNTLNKEEKKNNVGYLPNSNRTSWDAKLAEITAFNQLSSRSSGKLV